MGKDILLSRTSKEDERIFNSQTEGNQKTEAYIGEVWYTVASDEMTYNPQYKHIRGEAFAGQITTTARNVKVVLSCLCFACFNAAQAAPRLAVPPEGVVFGELGVGIGEARSIEVRNVSSFPVAVSQVKGCCGAEVGLAPTVIAPNASATLSVGLKPRVSGAFSKRIRRVS